MLASACHSPLGKRCSSVGYDKDGFKAQLDVAMKEGKSTAGASASYEKDGLSVSGSAKADLTEGELTELALKVGWKDPKAFTAFYLAYKGKYCGENQVPEHQFNAMFQFAVGKVATRFTGQLDMRGGAVKSTNLDLTGAYTINKDWKALGSVGYTGDRGTDNGAFQGHMNLGVGVQYKNVAIKATYTPDQKAWDVGIVIPF